MSKRNPPIYLFSVRLHCPACRNWGKGAFTNLRSPTEEADGTRHRRYLCNRCLHTFTLVLELPDEDEFQDSLK